MAGKIKNLNLLQKEIKVKFKNLKYLEEAVTHKSYANENRNKNIRDNERLEFLGDAVLDLVISEILFKRYKDYPEGELAKTRAVVVSAPTLARTAKKLNLGNYLRLGKGEEMTGGRKRDSILADAFEALVGAIYLDKGLKVVSKFIKDNLTEEIDRVERGEYIQDYKTLLQEEIQKRSNTRPLYRVVSEEGPDHDKRFTVLVECKNQILGKGVGKNKKEAQQRAAADAIERDAVSKLEEKL
ncbi:ribonuclease III [Anoxybacter fermentans]|uniref:Ribonuclease 3 n=1 Tax=Anoxybacter fermentans TaxID=1323375 RepID=A0A3Q9HPP0_9FIRM|nr:ribonuclease III [Anoxybacter fermentans]AZR72751.1 ribonuclease III [Anoxybacter fermentans]